MTRRSRRADRQATESSPPGFVGVHADVHVVRPDFTLTVAFELPAGATLAVVGPNGSGKSTLIGALAGHIPITSGAIRIGAQVVDDPSTSTFVEPEHRAVAYVHQEPLLFPHLSVRANVEFGLRANKVGGAERRLAAEAALASVGMLDAADAKPVELSGGQQQRVALARALVLDRPVLLLDEPLSKVDVSNRRTIRTSLADAGHTQIVATHGPEHARECAMILAIDGGKAIAFGPTSDIVGQPPSDWLAELFA